MSLFFHLKITQFAFLPKDGPWLQDSEMRRMWTLQAGGGKKWGENSQPSPPFQAAHDFYLGNSNQNTPRHPDISQVLEPRWGPGGPRTGAQSHNPPALHRPTQLSVGVALNPKAETREGLLSTAQHCWPWFCTEHRWGQDTEVRWTQGVLSTPSTRLPRSEGEVTFTSTRSAPQ